MYAGKSYYVDLDSVSERLVRCMYVCVHCYMVM